MDQNERIRQLQKSVEELQAMVTALQKTVKGIQRDKAELEAENKNLRDIIQIARKRQFGSSSEKTKAEDGFQLGIFNEAEAENKGTAAEPIRKTDKGYKETDQKTGREKLIADLPIQELECTLPEDEQRCPQCGSPLVRLGREIVREEIEYIPAKVKIIRIVRYSYYCPKCKKDGHPYIKKALTSSPVLNHSLASPTAVANVMYEKYVNAMPLNRQEKEWERCGLALSRTTLANWIIRCSEDWLEPVVDRLHRELAEREVVHCDETPVQVLKEPGKAPESKSYMWLYRSGKDGQPPIALYEYQPSRRGENAAAFLKGFGKSSFHGYMHTDGYSGYEKVTGVTRCGCWAHLRRYFVEAVPEKTDKSAEMTNAEIGRNYCDQLFHIESGLDELSAEERKEKRLQLEKPLLQAFWCWLESLNTLRGSPLGKAVTYAKKQKKYMENYLLDGRCSLSNNLAENAIRPFTVGRKNWLFCDSVGGAKASAAVYSIVETAKANGLHPFHYLQYLLQYMPGKDFHNDPQSLEDMLPWSEQAKEFCS